MARGDADSRRRGREHAPALEEVAAQELVEARRHGKVERMRLQGQALGATRAEAWDSDGGDGGMGRGERGKLFGDLGLAAARVKEVDGMDPEQCGDLVKKVPQCNR